MEIQIISGFLGAGKTTFLNKYLPLLTGKTAVVENDFGEVGLDGMLIKGDVPVTELNSGCICCSLAIDLKDGLAEIAEKYAPDRIVIEPSGIGRLSDVMKACEGARARMDIEITKRIVIVDACDCALFAEEFGQFYSDQIEHATAIFLSNVQAATEEEMEQCLACIQSLNPGVVVYEDDWRALDGEVLLDILAMAERGTGESELENPEYGTDGITSGIEEDLEVMFTPTSQTFSNVVLEDSCALTEEEMKEMLQGLSDRTFGFILRAKGIIPSVNEGFWHFDYTNSIQSYEKMDGLKEEMNRVIVIGSGLNKKAIRNYIYSFGEE